MLHAIPHLEGLGRHLPAVRTTLPGVAQSYLGRIFADHRLLLKSGKVDFAHQHTMLSDTSIGLLRYGTEVEVVAPALDFYLLQMTLGGEVGVRTSQFERTLGAGSVFVMNPGVTYRKHWSRDARQLMIKIPRQRLESRAAEKAGGGSGTSIVFANQVHPFSGAMMPLLRLIDYLCRDLSDDDGLLRDEYIRRQMEDALLGGILASVPHVQGRAVGQIASGAIPHYLRRGENHLRDNAFRSIKMSELTRIAEVSERTLQDAFLRFRGKTPGQFARELRLDLVRQALMAQAGCDDNVTKVALQFGFAHLGRFSRSYAERFGEFPSATLQRKRTH